MMKKNNRIIALLLTGMLLLAGCSGSGGSSSDSASYSGGDAKNSAMEDSAAYDYDYDGLESEEYAEDGEGEDQTNELTEASGLYDKLVFHGNVSIDTLDFEKSVADFKALVKEQGGFVETENYSDGEYRDYDYSYVSNSDKNKRYSATVRIPSRKYDTMMDSMGNLGDVRSKTSSTENFSQEYSDLSIKLNILQQTFDRYSALMENATDEDYILELQNRLTELQIQIEQTKSRMNRIDTDVAYSFLDVSFREVYKYEAHTAEPDSFMTRLKDTIIETWVDFLDFLENLLFLLIRLVPYLIIFGGLALIISLIIKVHRRKHPRMSKQQPPRQGTPAAPTTGAPATGETAVEETAGETSGDEVMKSDVKDAERYTK